MTEKTRIEETKIGYVFHISIEQEVRKNTEAKYPDKLVVKAMLEGNEKTFEETVKRLSEAKTQIVLILEKTTREVIP
jgi:hypothetical protein